VRACLDAASLWESAERSPDRITLRATAAFNTVLEFLS
jgi:hypothetical protein